MIRTSCDRETASGWKRGKVASYLWAQYQDVAASFGGDFSNDLATHPSLDLLRRFGIAHISITSACGSPGDCT